MPALAASAGVASRTGGGGLAGPVVVGLDLADCDERRARDR